MSQGQSQPQQPQYYLNPKTTPRLPPENSATNKNKPSLPLIGKMQKLLQNDILIQRPLLELLGLLPRIRGQPKSGHLICANIPDKKIPEVCRLRYQFPLLRYLPRMQI